jgi:hypothetical protein
VCEPDVFVVVQILLGVVADHERHVRTFVLGQSVVTDQLFIDS